MLNLPFNNVSNNSLYVSYNSYICPIISYIIPPSYPIMGAVTSPRISDDAAWRLSPAGGRTYMYVMNCDDMGGDGWCGGGVWGNLA